METRIPKRSQIKGVSPPIPKGWKLYQGPWNWKFVAGAKFWSHVENKWVRVSSLGAHAIPSSSELCPHWLIVPESGLAFWFYRFMSHIL